MTFKEQLAADIDNTFANTNEFFDWCDVDGKQMRVMTDDYELLDREKYSGNAPGMELPHKRRGLIYIPVKDYGPRPSTGKILVLYGKLQYRIVHVGEEKGLYSFTLEANK